MTRAKTARFGRKRLLRESIKEKRLEIVNNELESSPQECTSIDIDDKSKYSLYDQDLVTFEEGAVAYDHRDAAGFIKLNALRLRTLGQRKRKLGLK